MFTSLFQFLVAVLFFVMWWTILYFVVRGAVRSATSETRRITNQAVSLLAAQADLLSRLTKHLTAQSDLMLVQARHDGITDDQLANVTKQLEERKADPAFTMPFS